MKINLLRHQGSMTGAEIRAKEAEFWRRPSQERIRQILRGHETKKTAEFCKPESARVIVAMTAESAKNLYDVDVPEDGIQGSWSTGWHKMS